MKFLLELLGMTNQCNLRCTYCDWEKDKYKKLSRDEISNAKQHLTKIKKLIDLNFPEIGIVQYSGGEPLLYPEILNDVLTIFSDKWIRINTNGILLQDDMLNKIKKHGKTYIAISLDGSSLTSNYPRFRNNSEVLGKVLENIDKVVKLKIPLMILCTLNKYNIDKFHEFVDFLSIKYINEIQEGMLVMPAHSVTNYSKDNGVPILEAIDRFSTFLDTSMDKYQILNSIKEHYNGLIYYMKNKARESSCSVYDWSLSMHFRKNEIIEDGNFLSFGCGMRGVHELGLFNINNDKHIEKFLTKVASYKETKNIQSYNTVDQVSEYNRLNDNCEGKCFPDWVIFDMILSGKVSLDNAEKWFVLFRDENIKKIIQNYKAQV